MATRQRMTDTPDIQAPTMRTRDYRITLPEDDPRFTKMRELLESVRVRGKHSPVARMLGEWALLGYLLTTGTIAIGGETSGALQAAQQDLAALQSAQEQVAAALKDFAWE